MNGVVGALSDMSIVSGQLDGYHEFASKDTTVV
jgi:hypothetical protein